MQFSIISIVAALAATATASYVPSYNSTTVAPFATGTGSPTGTGIPSATVPVPTSTSTTPPFDGAGSSNVAGSAIALIVAGGVALLF
ncbi:hypothetical protein P154DRAFT_578270 [Amniculicola lignicola CBS 123094]|uniref:Uncharacterized protein n=1 Tax=Amniculicola lignicola CBS 123094 TaxID=1392246 RepID=A0A6A5W7S4_9PLEO|nr:hypothetical protein P154DRAFT_578270 [Amniculicola lignicola CBS 123094]